MAAPKIRLKEAELAALTDVIEADERQRCALGKIVGGKG